jgi:hypothetical protein
MGQCLQRPIRARGGQLLKGLLLLVRDQGLFARTFARFEAVSGY